jgi:hypothetical protein
MTHHPRVNRIVLALLRSPLHRLVDRTLCELCYEASGPARTVCLPVEYVRSGDDVVVLAAGAAGKRWWRAFRQPRPLRIRLDGVLRPGIGRVVHPDHPTSLAARQAYQDGRRTTVDSHDRILLITLLDDPGSARSGHGDAEQKEGRWHTRTHTQT